VIRRNGYDDEAKAVGLVMTDKAVNETPAGLPPYSKWIAAGWTRETLIAHGYAREFLHPLEVYAKHNYRLWFWEWLKHNEHILQVFTEHAREARRMGFEKYGAAGIIGVIRWHSREKELSALSEFSEESSFKITNNATSGLARLVMDIYPELDGLFNTHEHGNGSHGSDFDDDEE
jgi:hypothetical protein